MKASQLIKQAQELIDKYGDLDVLISFDSYCHNEFDSMDFQMADDKYHKDYFLI